jgi:hypothetical protein
MKIMKKISILFIFQLFFSGVIFTAKAEIAPGRKMAQQVTKDKKLWITTDHTKLDILKQEFKSGSQVTKACLSCHSEAASQFHKTIHWTWLDPATIESKVLGKGGLSINNF